MQPGITKCFLKRLSRYFLWFLCSPGNRIGEWICDLKSYFMECMEGGLVFCLFFSQWNHIWEYCQFWSSGKSRLVVLFTLEMVQTYWLLTWQDEKKLRNWAQVGGSYPDTEALLTLGLLFRKERTCKKDTTVGFPSWMNCWAWCVNHCWNTAFKCCVHFSFCVGTGAKLILFHGKTHWEHFNLWHDWSEIVSL